MVGVDTVVRVADTLEGEGRGREAGREKEKTDTVATVEEEMRGARRVAEEAMVARREGQEASMEAVAEEVVSLVAAMAAEATEGRREAALVAKGEVERKVEVGRLAAETLGVGTGVAEKAEREVRPGERPGRVVVVV